MKITYTDTFHRDWILEGVRNGRIHAALAPGGDGIVYKSQVYEDMLVAYFQHLVEQRYIVVWAETEYMLKRAGVEARNSPEFTLYQEYEFVIDGDSILEYT